MSNLLSPGSLRISDISNSPARSYEESVKMESSNMKPRIRIGCDINKLWPVPARATVFTAIQAPSGSPEVRSRRSGSAQRTRFRFGGEAVSCSIPGAPVSPFHSRLPKLGCTRLRSTQRKARSRVVGDGPPSSSSGRRLQRDRFCRLWPRRTQPSCSQPRAGYGEFRPPAIQAYLDIRGRGHGRMTQRTSKAPVQTHFCRYDTY